MGRDGRAGLTPSSGCWPAMQARVRAHRGAARQRSKLRGRPVRASRASGRRMEADPGSEDGSRRPGLDRKRSRVRGRRGPRRTAGSSAANWCRAYSCFTDGAARALREYALVATGSLVATGAGWVFVGPLPKGSTRAIANGSGRTNRQSREDTNLNHSTSGSAPTSFRIHFCKTKAADRSARRLFVRLTVYVS